MGVDALVENCFQLWVDFEIVQYSIDILRVDCSLIWIDHLQKDERVVAQHLSFNLKVELQVGVSQLSKLELLQVDLDAKV